MFVTLKASYRGADQELDVNPDHVSLVFTRGPQDDKRVLLRLADGVEIPLEKGAKREDVTRKLDAAREEIRAQEDTDPASD
jgi:hypothetical protein